MNDLDRLDATAQAQLVRDGEVSPQELVAAAAERIAALNPTLNAVIADLSEKALASAAGSTGRENRRATCSQVRSATARFCRWKGGSVPESSRETAPASTSAT